MLHGGWFVSVCVRSFCVRDDVVVVVTRGVLERVISGGIVYTFFAR